MKNSDESIDVYNVILSIEAQQFFETSSASLQRRLDRCFDQLKLNPRFHPNIKSLRGNFAGRYRYRIGDYRVVYYVNDEERQVVVTAIAHRREVYE